SESQGGCDGGSAWFWGWLAFTETKLIRHRNLPVLQSVNHKCSITQRSPKGEGEESARHWR
ncbi:MAG TPA: hypothetical protein VJL90_05445, partial [Pseudorhodoplanes sp.]|nr:hypothetical protein [Pseudorhodoplanes sp.]